MHIELQALSCLFQVWKYVSLIKEARCGLCMSGECSSLKQHGKLTFHNGIVLP